MSEIVNLLLLVNGFFLLIRKQLLSDYLVKTTDVFWGI